MKNHLFSVEGNLCNLNSTNVAGFLLIQQQQIMSVTRTEYQSLLRDAGSANLSYHLPALGLEHLHCCAAPGEFCLSQ